ncbi:MAG: ribonuclease HIII [Bacilli bacterium]|nr:ribonuclease HIII [Bacilli bacterium]
MPKNEVKTYTVKVSENTMDKMKEYFEDKKREKTPPYAVFQANEADTVVTLYESGKAVFQGISADIDANIWIETEKHLNPDKKVTYKVAGSEGKKKIITKNNNLYYSNSIGSDEVGTGDYFGPIVVTAAYVTKDNIKFLEDLGVRDSKKMTDEHILKIVPEIIKKIPYSCMILSNKDYNSKYNENMNMNKIKAILHNKVLLDLTKEYKNVDYVVVDQFTTPSLFYKYINESIEKQQNITFVTKAEDQCLSVACGAIISRYVFIKEFDKLSKMVGVTLPKGASTLVDEAGVKIVKQHGDAILNEIAKCNFKNTEKIKDLAK